MSQAQLRAPISIIGAGAIGLSFAARFAMAGASVRVYEADADRRAAAQAEFADRLELLHSAGLLADIAATAALVEFSQDLAAAVADAVLVQEAISESLPAKHALLAELAALADRLAPGAVIASSSSVLVPSATFADSPLAAQGLVAHPLNPPDSIPLIELVPGPATSAETMTRADELYRAAGMRPVLLQREIAGFVTNRLQAAMLREAYLLVADGIIDPDGVDTVVREGLGRRWAFYGPFEVADLNTRGGIAAHAERLGGAYGAQATQRADSNPWLDAELVARVAAARRERLPLDDWLAATAERDAKVRRLARLAAEIEEN